MITKEKKKIFVGMIIILLLLIIYIIYNIYSNKIVSYASNDNVDIQISNAQKVDIENIIKQKQQSSKEEILVEETDLEYITEYKNNKELPKGTIQVAQEGRSGLQQVTIKRTTQPDGEIKEEQINSIIIKSAVNKIVEIGTSTNTYSAKITKGSNAYVTSDRANIMRENSLQSEKITTIKKDTEVKVIEINDDWCKISTNSKIGWIKIENITSKNPSKTYEEEKNTISPISFEMELNKPSGLTLEQFQKVLTDSKDVNKIFSENAEYFYYIEKQYNINGIFIASIGIHESAWGTSRISANKKNLFGYGAYDSSPYNSSYNFTTYSEGIDLIARVMVKYYLNPKGTAIYGNEIANGKYYNGNTLSAVNKKYATDKNWANKVYKYMEYLYKKI